MGLINVGTLISEIIHHLDIGQKSNYALINISKISEVRNASFPILHNT